MKPYLMIAVLAALAAAPALGGALELEIPAHVEWCTTLSVKDATRLATQEARQAAFGDAGKSITDCARANAQSLSRIGVPALSESVPASADGKEMQLTFCAAVSPVKDDPPSCEKIVVRRVAAQRVVFGACPQEVAESCPEKMAEELRGNPWKLDEKAIQALPWRFAQLTDAVTDDVDTMIAFLTFGTVRAAGPTNPAAAPEKVLPFVVVVAPLPPAPPPAVPPTQPGAGRG